MRVGVFGNTAQNAYLLARFLREYEGIEADCYLQGNAQPLWHPEWEEADVDLAALPRGGAPPVLDGWTRPSWVKTLLGDAQPPAYLAALVPAEVAQEGRGVLLQFDDLADPRPDRMGRLDRWQARQNYSHLIGGRQVVEVARAYDVTVWCGPFARYGILLSKRERYVTLEHATMRYVPRREQAAERLLALAYRYADWNVLTNPDCARAAWELGLTRFGMIPHPVDTAKFRPGAVPAWRDELLDDYGAAVLFLSPTRHATERLWGSKRTDKAVAAFAHYVAVEEPAGAPRALLVLLDYGEGAAAVRAQLAALGLAGRVYWMGLQPKRRLADWYRAADVVLDQFAADVGSFGTCTVEALATGKPVVTWVDPAAHAWCRDALPHLPPVANALEVPEIAAHLGRLGRDPAARAAAGAAGRAWVDRWHGPARVAGLHAALLRQVLH